MFTERLHMETGELGLHGLTIDGSMSVDALVDSVGNRLFGRRD